jgi:hypothetical protein
MRTLNVSLPKHLRHIQQRLSDTEFEKKKTSSYMTCIHLWHIQQRLSDTEFENGARTIKLSQ